MKHDANNNNNNKRLLATGPPTPRLLCKSKYWTYYVIASVRSVEKAQQIEHNIHRIYFGAWLKCGMWYLRWRYYIRQMCKQIQGSLKMRLGTYNYTTQISDNGWSNS